MHSRTSSAPNHEAAGFHAAFPATAQYAVAKALQTRSTSAFVSWFDEGRQTRPLYKRSALGHVFVHGDLKMPILFRGKKPGRISISGYSFIKCIPTCSPEIPSGKRAAVIHQTGSSPGEHFWSFTPCSSG